MNVYARALRAGGSAQFRKKIVIPSGENAEERLSLASVYRILGEKPESPDTPAPDLAAVGSGTARPTG